MAEHRGYTADNIRFRLEFMFRQGLTYEEIGRRLDLHERTVRYWLRRIGIAAYKKPVTDAERERMAALRAEGLTQRKIAARIGRSERTVRDHLRKVNHVG